MTKQETSSFQKILVFNTTSRDQTSVALVVNGKVKKLVEPVRAQDLQKLTDELLKSVKEAQREYETGKAIKARSIKDFV